MKRYKIALISAGARPIPAVHGGATETMMTHVLNENEIGNRLSITVFGYYDKEALEEAKKLKNTNFISYNPTKWMDNLYLLFFRAMRKLTKGKTYIKTRYVKFCINEIKKENYDAVLIEGNYFQVLQFRKAIKNKMILHVHIDGLSVETDNAKRIVDSCSGIFAISDYCNKRISEIDPSQSQKVHTLKNTIDTNLFTYDYQFRNEFREKNGITLNDTVFVYCGRIDEVKGVYELLEAFKSLDRKDIRLLIVGSSCYDDGEQTPYTKKVAKLSDEIKEQVIFTGFIPQSDLPKYYSAADIFVIPSKWQEAAGNVTIEAMSVGLPVIASKRGGIPEYADTKASILVDYNKDFVDNIANAMKTYLDDKEIMAEKKAHARECALVYDKKNYYQNFCNAINESLKGTD